MAGADDLSVHSPGGSSPAGGGGGSLRRLLVAVDDPRRSQDAVSAAAGLCVPLGGLLRIVHVRVWDPAGRVGMGRFFYETSADATAVLERAVAAAWDRAARASGVVVDAPRARERR